MKIDDFNQIVCARWEAASSRCLFELSLRAKDGARASFLRLGKSNGASLPQVSLCQSVSCPAHGLSMMHHSHLDAILQWFTTILHALPKSSMLEVFFLIGIRHSNYGDVFLSRLVVCRLPLCYQIFCTDDKMKQGSQMPHSYGCDVAFWQTRRFWWRSRLPCCENVCGQ